MSLKRQCLTSFGVLEIFLDLLSSRDADSNGVRGHTDVENHVSKRFKVQISRSLEADRS